MATMPWHYDMEEWSSRAWLAVAGNALAGAYITVIPPQTDEFWDGIQSDGDDLRVRAYNYTTTFAAFEHSNDAPNTATRTIGNFLIELPNLGADVIYPVAVYYGNSAATNGEGTVTTTNATTYRWCTAKPDPKYTVLCRSEPAGTALSLLQAFVKKQDEEIDLWWDMTDALGEGPIMAGRKTTLYSLTTVNFDATFGTGVYESTGTTRDTSSTEQANTAFVEVDGRFYVGLRLTADAGHTSGSDYIVKLRGYLMAFTADAANASLVEYEFRALMQVRDTTS